MPQIISFIIQKGGCGKTTTTANTASYLSLQGFRILAIDMDPQGNLTQHFGYDTDHLDATIKDLFQKTKELDEVLIKRNPTLHLLPNNIEMASMEFDMYKTLSREYLLRDVLGPIRQNYDYILIDCPPNLGIFSINALATSTDFVLVVSPEFFPMKAIRPLYNTFLMVRKKLNRSLQFRGVLMTMCDFRTRHSQEVRDILAKNFPSKLYKSYIRNNVTLKEAASVGQSIFEYDPNSMGAFDYQNFAEEFNRDNDVIRKKRDYYDRRFADLSEEEKEEILKFARNNLSSFNRNRLNVLDEEPFLKEAFILERNKIIERLYPYRSHAAVSLKE